MNISRHSKSNARTDTWRFSPKKSTNPSSKDSPKKKDLDSSSSWHVATTNWLMPRKGSMKNVSAQEQKQVASTSSNDYYADRIPSINAKVNNKCNNVQLDFKSKLYEREDMIQILQTALERLCNHEKLKQRRRGKTLAFGSDRGSELLMTRGPPKRGLLTNSHDHDSSMPARRGLLRLNEEPDMPNARRGLLSKSPSEESNVQGRRGLARDTPISRNLNHSRRGGLREVSNEEPKTPVPPRRGLLREPYRDEPSSAEFGLSSPPESAEFLTRTPQPSRGPLVSAPSGQSSEESPKRKIVRNPCGESSEEHARSQRTTVLLERGLQQTSINAIPPVEKEFLMSPGCSKTDMVQEAFDQICQSPKKAKLKLTSLSEVSPLTRELSLQDILSSSPSPSPSNKKKSVLSLFNNSHNASFNASNASFNASSCDKVNFNSKKKSSPKRDVNARKMRRSLFSAAIVPKIMEDFEEEIQTELVIIEGAPGTGKTALVEGALKEKVEDEDGYFCSCKFDHVEKTAKPWEAITNCLGDLCEEMYTTCVFKDVKNLIYKTLQSEVSLLEMLIPSTRKFTENENPGQQDVGTIFQIDEQQLTRIRRLFRSFIQIACNTSKNPIVLFFDGVQRADQSSLEFLTYLCSNLQGLERLMLVITYQNNESSLQTKLTENVALNKVNVTTLTVEDLSFGALEELIRDATYMTDREKISSLAELVYNKTRGNAHFTIEFLKALKDDELLYFSAITFTWEWDAERIHAETALSDNVVDLVVSKLRRLDKTTRDVLMIGACMGSTFNVDLIGSILIECGIKPSEVKEILGKKAVQDLVYKQKNSEWFCFSHDKVQQAAYALLPEGGERENLHYRIGSQLLDKVKNGADSLITLAADQFNRCQSLLGTMIKHNFLAELNLKAAQKLIDMSAFFTALQYLQIGLDHIKSCDGWMAHYQLTLELSTLLGQMHMCHGDIESSRRVAQEVASNAKTVSDQAAAYCTLLSCARAEGSTHDMKIIGRTALNALGVRIPSKIAAAHLMFEFNSTKKMMRHHTDGDILQLKLMDDEEKKAAVNLLNYLSQLSFFKSSMTSYYFLKLRMLKLTLQYGVCKLSPCGLSGYGQLLAAKGDFENGHRFGDLAMKLSRRLHHETFSTLRCFSVNSLFLSHLRKPVQQSIPQAMEGFKIRMAKGEFGAGCIAAITVSFLRLFSGQSLEFVEEEMVSTEKQFEEYKEVEALTITMLRKVLVEPLLGKTDPLDASVNKFVLEAKEMCNLHFVNVLRLVRTFYFGDADDLVEYENEAWNGVFHLFPTAHHTTVLMCFLGIAEYTIARTQGSRKHARRAGKLLKILKGHVQKGNPNAEHLFLLLDAERMRFTKTKSKQKVIIKAAYNKAIKSAARSGFINNAAVANEQLATYLVDVDQLDLASFYMEKAYAYFVEWGAAGKVKQLKEKYGFLLKDLQNESVKRHLSPMTPKFKRAGLLQKKSSVRECITMLNLTPDDNDRAGTSTCFSMKSFSSEL